MQHITQYINFDVDYPLTFLQQYRQLWAYLQKYGVEYDEVFAPVANETTLRILLTVAGHHKMTVKHYDIRGAFLNGELSHEVYFHEHGDDLVCKLNKSLCGLTQRANEWNK